MVVLAGPNGCGKSVALDAVRLLKSSYGGYQYDEWRQWYGEFQINLSDPESMWRLFRDKTRPLEISAEISLDPSEKQYLNENAERLLERIVWRQVLGREVEPGALGAMAMSTELRVHGESVRARAAEWAAALRSELEQPVYELALGIPTTAQPEIAQCMVADVVFQTYEPKAIGVIDYHSAGRAYNREGIGGVHVNLTNVNEQRRQQSLYNWQAKYQNIKTELASSYVRELFAERAGAQLAVSDLNETLKDLFQTFFPNKTYEGPRPTSEGMLEFPVQLTSGEVHDIDDLSSGEKEILYGYLRLRNSAPRNSVVLLDEPELHLNPGLLQGLPDFYHRNLGRALNNQIWLVTHSDALLRQAVGNENFSTFHLRTASTTGPGENQALPILADDELERAVIDLVGDLATYKPNAKVVILEGGGDTDFDVSVVSRLFPDLAQRVNLVSGGGKRRVRDLYAMFAGAAEAAGLAERFVAILDGDSAVQAIPELPGVKRWDRYHIERYLLEPKFILAGMAAVSGPNVGMTEEQILEALRTCAADLVPRLVLERLQAEANRRLVSKISIGAAPDSADPIQDLRPSIEGSLSRFTEATEELLEENTLAEIEESFRAELHEALDSEEWVRVFPGRLILSRFVSAHVQGVDYEAFRNLVLDQMVDDGFEPAGMQDLLAEI